MTFKRDLGLSRFDSELFQLLMLFKRRTVRQQMVPIASITAHRHWRNMQLQLFLGEQFNALKLKFINAKPRSSVPSFDSAYVVKKQTIGDGPGKRSCALATLIRAQNRVEESHSTSGSFLSSFRARSLTGKLPSLGAALRHIRKATDRALTASAASASN